MARFLVVYTQGFRRVYQQVNTNEKRAIQWYYITRERRITILHVYHVIENTVPNTISGMV